MKKTLLIVALLALALGAFGIGTVFAQDVQPPYNGGGRGMMGGGNGQGLLHDYMVTEFAAKLDLDAADLETRIAAGETMYDIALSAGVTAEEFPAVMTEVRSAALDAAVKDNVITQEQADFMKTRGQGMGNGTGTCDGTQQGMRGQGQGQGRGMMNGGGFQNQQTNP